MRSSDQSTLKFLELPIFAPVTLLREVSIYETGI